MDLPDSGFAVFWILFLFYCFIYLDKICGSAREWICCKLDVVFILKWRA